MHKEIKWPKKTREMQTSMIDSTYWNDFEFRDDDIIVGTYQKAGTTWVQQIIAQFVFNGETEGMPVGDISPWLDLRLPPLEAKLPDIIAQKHRRFLKTHLPVDTLVFSEKVKYIYIARDGRDVLWSLYNHHTTANDAWYEALNDTPGLVGPRMEKPAGSIVEYYPDWLDQDGYPFWSFWENITSWWDIRDLPNVNLIHFGALKEDMPGEIRKIAAYLEIDIDESKWDLMVHHCGFDYMKKNATLSTPLGGVIFTGGADSFIFKGINDRWRDTLNKADIEAYEGRALVEVGPECAHWLATGKF